MPRKVKSRELDTREARSKLTVRGTPYWRALDKGLHLGYRRLKGKSGTWGLRRYTGDREYERVWPIGIADDQSEADGIEVLDIWQAQEKARQIAGTHAQGQAGSSLGPYTVDQALDAYFNWLETEGRSAESIKDAQGRADGLIRPQLGKKEIDKLTTKQWRDWRDAIVKTAPRVRSRPGDEPRHRNVTDDDEAKRARRSSANRVWTILRAALNYAFDDGKIKSTDWRKVKPFKGVDKARIRYLEIAEAKRLTNATDPEFRPMVEAALLTGGRYGQLARLVVADFNRTAGTVRMSTRKGDGTMKVYHVHLTDEGRRFFERASAGRKKLIFSKLDGTAWQKSEQARPMHEASSRAGIEPAVNFHCTRHTYASHAAMNGAPLLVIAQNLGHSDTRMVEKHYGHLAPSYKAEMIRTKAPKFGFKPDAKVVTLR